MLYYKVKKILDGRGLSADFSRDVMLLDDGSGTRIGHWDESRLGPMPSQADLDAVSAADANKVKHNAIIIASIANIEASRPGYVRGVREFMLGVAQIVAQIPGAPDLMQTPGMQNVKTLDDAIKALRAQLQA